MAALTPSLGVGGVAMSMHWDTAKWDHAYKETVRLLGDLTPVMMLIGMHMEGSVKKTLHESGSPAGSFAPVLRGGKPLLDTGQHILSRIFFAGADAHEARVSVGWEFAAVHQFGAHIEAKRADYLRFQVGGQWASKQSVDIPARPFMVFRPEDPQKIAEVAKAQVEAAFGGGTGAFWSMVL